MAGSGGLRDLVGRAATAYGIRNRQRKITAIMDAVARLGARTVLVVGVNDHVDPKSNLIEQALLARDDLGTVFSGIAPVVEGFPSYVQADGRALPFRAGSFDLVVSNAVVEHVGDEADQRRFIAEHDRVGRHWFTTTPNRAFPVESHYHQVLAHWSPRWHDPRGDVTRLLTPPQLRALLPRGGITHGGWASPTLWASSWG